MKYIKIDMFYFFINNNNNKYIIYINLKYKKKINMYKINIYNKFFSYKNKKKKKKQAKIKENNQVHPSSPNYIL